nr:ribonuclease H-like domain-containing protein [Tanacetum cinerariifolium]
AHKKPPGVIGWWPSRSVTFLDNHDTGSTQGHWPFSSHHAMEQSQVATLLLLPVVFYGMGAGPSSWTPLVIQGAKKGLGSATSFGDDEDATQLTGTMSTAKGKKRGRGRGRHVSSLKQKTLDASTMFWRSERTPEEVLAAKGVKPTLSPKFDTLALVEAHMVGCNFSRTPVFAESKLGDDGDLVSDSTLYRSLASSLQYLTFTRPNISYAVQQVYLYMHDLREPHFSARKRILRYVRGTLDYGLQLFTSSTTSLVAYSDADWAGCPITRRSTSGYCVFLGNNLLSWSSKRQPTHSRSSAKAKYRGVANAIVETAGCEIYYRQRLKHIEIDIHFVHDLLLLVRFEFFMFLLVISIRIGIGVGIGIDIDIGIDNDICIGIGIGIGIDIGIGLHLIKTLFSTESAL